MTTFRKIEIDCPSCGSKFESLSLNSTNTFGRKTDFQPMTMGFSPLPLYIHTCPQCGFSGYQNHFEGEISDELKAIIKEQLTPLLEEEDVFSGRSYEYTALIQQWSGKPPQEVAQLYLTAAWSCSDDKRLEDESNYRRKAIENFELALNHESLSQSEIPTITYLIGELYRRINDEQNAALWFDRVAKAAEGDPESEWLIERAERQKTDPDDTF